MIRVIPGHVAATSARILVIAAPATQPSVTFVAPDGAETPLVPTSTTAGKPELRGELARYGIEIHVALAENLTPSTVYKVRVRVANEAKELLVRTLPPRVPDDGITIFVGSCFYNGFSRAARYLGALQGDWLGNSAFKLLVGDNIYVDAGESGRVEPAGGFPETVDDYLSYMVRGAYGDFWEAGPTLATWDDHEFWNNFPEPQGWLSRTWTQKDRAAYTKAALDCIDAFQRPLNPPAVAGGRAFSFMIDPISFFVTDFRTQRTRYEPADQRALCTNDELEALLAWTRGLESPGVLVIGQPLWMKSGGRTDYNPPDFENQYARIWNALAEAPHDVLIVTGDVHHSRLLWIALGQNRNVYEFTTSPACHIPDITSTIGRFLIGTGEHQDRGSVEFPGKVPMDSTRFGRVVPTLGSYLMGTDAPNTCGVLHLTPTGSGGLTVGCAFLDHGSNGLPAIASSSKARIDGLIGKFKPYYDQCIHTRAVNMK